jgi:hypothetical protein
MPRGDVFLADASVLDLEFYSTMRVKSDHGQSEYRSWILKPLGNRRRQPK